MEIVVFDLETTGFSPNNGDEIISFGGDYAEGEKVIEGRSFYSLVNPKRKVPAHIVEFTGISNRWLESAPDLCRCFMISWSLSEKEC